MSIIDQDGMSYTVICDTKDCLSMRTFTAGSAEEFLQTVTDNRWETVVTTTGIEHTCPECCDKKGETDK